MPPDRASFTAMLTELHAELRHYPGSLPERGPLRDLDAALALLGRPEELVAARDALVARWPGGPAQALHGDSHARNVLITPWGPLWNDFEDAWHGPVGGRAVLAGAARALRRVLDEGPRPLPNPNTLAPLISTGAVPRCAACRDSCWSWRTNGPSPT